MTQEFQKIELATSSERMASLFITRFVGWSAARFYRLEIRGETIPHGAVLVVANHPNALLDPIIIFRAAERVVRPLAKEPLFHHPLIGPMLKALGGLPVYRKQDHPELMHQNENTFAAAVAALHAGDAVQIYPEGQSHSEARVNPLKTGAARIALRAEEEAEWKLGLQITPVGLTYVRKSFFRGRAIALVGESFGIGADWTVERLTEEIAHRLETLTLHLSRTEDAALIDTAERMYAREKGIASWRDVDDLGDRLPRMQAFGRGVAWLRAHDPARHQRLEHAVKRYRTQAELLGARDGDVPPRYGVGGVLWYVLREAVVLGLGLPIAAVALLFWYPPYALNKIVMQRLRVDETGIATHKLGLALLLTPLTLLIWITLAWYYIGWGGAIVTAVVLPLIGLVLLAWADRWEKVKEDAALFFRVMRRPRSQDKLAQQRAQLVAEFDRVLKDAPGVAGGGFNIS